MMRPVNCILLLVAIIRVLLSLPLRKAIIVPGGRIFHLFLVDVTKKSGITINHFFFYSYVQVDRGVFCSCGRFLILTDRERECFYINCHFRYIKEVDPPLKEWPK